MKNLKTVDLEKARNDLISACQQFITDNAHSYWANNSLIGKSPVQLVRNLIKDFKNETSAYQLVRRVSEYKSDSQLTQNLKYLVLLKIYALPEKGIEELGKEIARNELFIASRGFASYDHRATVVPHMNTAINQLFATYFAKSVPDLPVMVELSERTYDSSM